MKKSLFSIPDTEIKTCIICNKEFQNRASEFCSSECATIDQNRIKNYEK